VGHRAATALAAALIVAGAPVLATPIQWTIGSGGNGHYYDVVGTTMTWAEARDYARSLQYLSLPGHLASFTSAPEWDFVWQYYYAHGISINQDWLGGFQADKTSEPAGGWQWVTGEGWGYTAWSTGEPNNSGGAEDYLQVAGGSKWNDIAGTNRFGSLVEYQGHSPEPGTWALLLCGGLVGTAWLRRRRA
jgi:hypothetical protein